MSMEQGENIGYWLFYSQRCVAYAFSEVLKAYCIEHEKPYVVTPPQWGALSLLAEHDGLTIGTLSQRRGVDAPTMTGIITRLEQNRLVERRHNREDRRVVKVYLTDEGREGFSGLQEAAETFNDTMLRGLSKAEQQDILTKLQQIIINVSSVAMGTGDRFGLLPESLSREHERAGEGCFSDLLEKE